MDGGSTSGMDGAVASAGGPGEPKAPPGVAGGELVHLGEAEDAADVVVPDGGHHRLRDGLHLHGPVDERPQRPLMGSELGIGTVVGGGMNPNQGDH